MSTTGGGLASDGSLVVRPLPRGAADDGAVMSTLTDLVNEVYAESDRGLWLDGAARTDPGELAEFTRADEIVVAELRGRIAGCVRTRRLDFGTAEFGMLAAAPDCRGSGVGRELVRFAEDAGRAAGCRRMQLELLVPREWSHPAKQFLATWYDRIGYQVVRVGRVDEFYPQSARVLATPCAFWIYHKDLTSGRP